MSFKKEIKNPLYFANMQAKEKKVELFQCSKKAHQSFK